MISRAPWEGVASRFATKPRSGADLHARFAVRRHAAVFWLGLWAADRYMRAVGVHDPGAIVVDEVAGQWLTLAVAPLDPLAYLAGFLLFRVFDVLKPWPAGWLDRRVGGAFGVMIDDIAAAAYAGGALAVLVTWFLP